MIPYAGEDIHHILILGEYKVHIKRANYYNSHDTEALKKSTALAIKNHLKPKSRKIIINTNNYSGVKKNHMLCIDVLIISKNYTGPKNKIMGTIKYRLGDDVYNIVKNNVGLCDIYVDFVDGYYLLGL